MLLHFFLDCDRFKKVQKLVYVWVHVYTGGYEKKSIYIGVPYDWFNVNFD